MADEKSRHQVKTMGLFVSEGRPLASPGFDDVSQKPHFRPLGGQVEFGERSEGTLAREMREELGADVEVGELLEVVQNVYVFIRRQKHEIAFIQPRALSGRCVRRPGRVAQYRASGRRSA
jgi:hypothetical protein